MNICKRKPTCNQRKLIGFVILWQLLSFLIGGVANMDGGKPQGHFYESWFVVSVVLGLVLLAICAVGWCLDDCKDCKVEENQGS